MSITPIEPSARATYNLGINASQLGIGRHADKFSIKNVYIDVDDTHIKVVPFDFTDDVDDNGSVLALPATTIGSAYQIQFYAAGKMLLSAFFEMPERDCFLAELKLYTAMPAREQYPEGAPGKSAYQSAIDTGVFEGTEEQFAQWQKPTINDVDLLADIKVINDVTTLPSGVTVPRRIGSDVYSLSTFNDRLADVNKVLTQTGGTVDIGGIPVKTIKQATDDALNIATAPIYDFVDAGKDEVIERPLGPSFKPLSHYLEYLDAIKSVFTQSSGDVTINGVARKSLQQALSEVDVATNNVSQLVGSIGTQVNTALQEAALDNSIIPTDALIKVLPLVGGIARSLASKNADSVSPYDFGGIGDGLYHPLSERFDTLIAAKAVYSFAEALTDSIDYCALRAFYDYCTANFVPRPNLTFNAYVHKKLLIEGEMKTLSYYGDLLLTNTQDEVEIEALIQINVLRYKHFGRLALFGTRGAVKTRKQLGGLLVGDGGTDGSAGRVFIDTIESDGFKYFGSLFINDSIFPSFNYNFSGNIGANGKVASEPKNADNATILNRFDVKSYSPSQYSELTVDNLPPAINGLYGFKHPVMLRHGTELHRVLSVDAVSSKIRVYPCLKFNELENTTINYIYGIGFGYIGNNAGCGNFGHMQSILSGVGFWGASLYGANITYATTEFCGLGFTTGQEFDAAIAYTVGNAYFEGNDFNYVNQWSNDHYSSVNFLNAHELDLSKSTNLFDYRIDIYEPENGGQRVRTPINGGSFYIDGESFNVNMQSSMMYSLSSSSPFLHLSGAANIQLEIDVHKTVNIGMYQKLLVMPPREAISTLLPPVGWSFSGISAIPASDKHIMITAYVRKSSMTIVLVSDAIAAPA